MIVPEDVINCLKPHLNRLLTIAEVVLHPEQFKAYRKLTLDELGRNGFEQDVRELFGSEDDNRR